MFEIWPRFVFLRTSPRPWNRLVNGLPGGKLNLPYHYLYVATARGVENCDGRLMRLSRLYLFAIMPGVALLNKSPCTLDNVASSFAVSRQRFANRAK